MFHRVLPIAVKHMTSLFVCKHGYFTAAFSLKLHQSAIIMSSTPANSSLLDFHQDCAFETITNYNQLHNRGIKDGELL